MYILKFSLSLEVSINLISISGNFEQKRVFLSIPIMFSYIYQIIPRLLPYVFLLFFLCALGRQRFCFVCIPIPNSSHVEKIYQQTIGFQGAVMLQEHLVTLRK